MLKESEMLSSIRSMSRGAVSRACFWELSMFLDEDSISLHRSQGREPDYSQMSLKKHQNLPHLIDNEQLLL